MPPFYAEQSRPPDTDKDLAGIVACEGARIGRQDRWRCDHAVARTQSPSQLGASTDPQAGLEISLAAQAASAQLAPERPDPLPQFRLDLNLPLDMIRRIVVCQMMEPTSLLARLWRLVALLPMPRRPTAGVAGAELASYEDCEPEAIEARGRRLALGLVLVMVQATLWSTRAAAQTVPAPAEASPATSVVLTARAWTLGPVEDRGVVRPVSAGSQPERRSLSGEIGFEHRFRWEQTSNATDYDDRRDDRRTQFRFRTRLWAQLLLTRNLEVSAGLANESRAITTPHRPAALDEIFFEHLYVDWKIDGRHRLRVGRQNLMRGEGFTIADATSLDGSRSAYFNAILFTRVLAPNSTLELLAIDNPRRDRWLPRIKDRGTPLVEWDERAFGGYLTEERVPRTTIEAYVLRKTERHDSRDPSHPQYHADRSFAIAGARAVHQLGGGWSFHGEIAGEWGRLDAGSGSVRAWGGYSYVRKATTWAWKPVLQAGHTAMSGDDPSTPSDEGWHPLFARWTKWGEIYFRALGSERGAGYWSNLSMWQAELTASPATAVALRATYYRLGASHPRSGSASTFGDGTDRGHMVQTRLDVTLHRSLRGHVLYEHLWPGDFARVRSHAYFLRVELTYTFRHQFGRAASR